MVICCGVNLKHTVNLFVIVDHYPLPLIDDVFSSVHECKVFCTLDFSNAYLQLRVDESSQLLLTMNTHKGLYQYIRLCFGLNSAPSIFQ